MGNYYRSDVNEDNAQESRNSTGSEVILTNGSMATTAVSGVPNISNLNITKSSQVHIGPKLVSVTQNVVNEEGVKGQFLCFEVVSEKSKRRLRCSVAVFVCWALIVACGLAVYLFRVVLAKQSRLDIELPFYKVIWTYIRSTTLAERVTCMAASIAVIACVMLIIYFTVIAKSDKDDDYAPHEWNISRQMWLAQDWVHNPNYTTLLYQPVNLVIIQHTVSAVCRTFLSCADEIRNLQKYAIHECDCDISYNFLVGNDGRIYEGRGLGVGGAHTKGYNLCSIGVGFIGDYRNQKTEVTKLQIHNFNLLLQDAINRGYLASEYYVIGAKDVKSTESPGTNLYNEMKSWPHYDHKHQFQNKSCAQIKTMFNHTHKN